MVCNIEIPADKVLEFQNAMGDNYGNGHQPIQSIPR